MQRAAGGCKAVRKQNANTFRELLTELRARTVG